MKFDISCDYCRSSREYGMTVSDNEDECEFTVAINFCPKCGRKLTEA